MIKILNIMWCMIAVLVLVFIYFFFVFRAPQPKRITWGVNFSQMEAESLKLDWRKNYLAIMEDLGAKNIKLITDWDWIEGKKNNFYFNDIDWQIQQAESHKVNIIYVVGMKTGRWPECHVPAWADTLSQSQQQTEILDYLNQVVTRYKASPAISAWQVENEPLVNFGQCPWYDKAFLMKEVALVKSLDPSRPVIISDSGEQSLWLDAAKIGDIVATTMYRKVWFHITDSLGFYFTYPIPPVFYYYKSQLVQYLFNKRVICGELQAEPWAYAPFSNVSLQEQEKSMNLQQFKANISYAKQTGLDQFYLWGVEWWYWLKETQNQPQIWNYAKEIFKQ